MINEIMDVVPFVSIEHYSTCTLFVSRTGTLKNIVHA